MTADEVLDARRFAGVADALGADVEILIEEFIATAAADLQALESTDHEVARAAAHRLKGGAMTVGASRLQACCVAFSEDLKAGRVPPPDRVREIRAALDAAIAAMRAAAA